MIRLLSHSWTATKCTALRVLNTYRAKQNRPCARMVTACCLVLAVANAVLAVRIHAAPTANGYVRQLNQGIRGLREGKWIAAAHHFRLALEWDHKGVDARIGLGVCPHDRPRCPP